MIRLPGRCGVCRAELVWNGKMWRNPRGTSRHVCPEDRPTCGAMMPNALERCARRPGHTTEHRTRYALDNARYNHMQERGGRRRPQPSAPPRSCY